MLLFRVKIPATEKKMKRALLSMSFQKLLTDQKAWFFRVRVLLGIVIELLKNKLHELSPPGGLVSAPGGFTSLLFDQWVP